MSDVFDEFHKWVGISITEWAHVEDYLYLVCFKCMRSPPDVVSIVYYRTPTLDARIKLISELVSATIPKPKRKNGGHAHTDKQAWNSIESEFQGLFATRRRIAHHPMRANLDYEVPGGFRVHIETSFAEELRGRGQRLPPLKLTDLHQHVIKLQAITGRLKVFAEETLPKYV